MFQIISDSVCCGSGGNCSSKKNGDKEECIHYHFKLDSNPFDNSPFSMFHQFCCCRRFLLMSVFQNACFVSFFFWRKSFLCFETASSRQAHRSMQSNHCIIQVCEVKRGKRVWRQQSCSNYKRRICNTSVLYIYWYIWTQHIV